MQSVDRQPGHDQTPWGRVDLRSLRSASPAHPGHPPAGTQPTVGSDGLPPSRRQERPALGGGLLGPGGVVGGARALLDVISTEQSPRVEGAGPSGPVAPAGRNLDTLRTSLKDLGTTELSPRGQLVLPGHQAQLGFDRAPYEPPVGTPTNPYPEPGIGEPPPAVPVAERRQTCFAFSSDGVQLGFDDWQPEFGRWLRWHEPHDRKRAERVERCGSMWQVRRCKDCGTHDTTKPVRSADCDSRVCPSCAREAAREREQFLRDAVKSWPLSSRGKSWWMWTLTSVKSAGRSIELLIEDFEKVGSGWRAAWAILKKRGCDRAWLKFEVGPGGMVHCHVLVFGPFTHPDVLAKVRAAYESVTGANQVNVKRATKRGIIEVAKYLCKGLASSDSRSHQTHPALAAMVDVALRGARIVREYGTWDGMGFTPPPEVPRWCCPCCGAHESHAVYLTPAQLAALRAKEDPGGGGRTTKRAPP